MTWKIINGNNTEVLKQYPDNSFDAVVTDPPYGISFLGKDWDSKKATETTSKLTALHNLPSGMKHTSLADDLEFQKWMSEVFAECWRVLKPGGHLLAFSAARTYHHMAMAAQFAGFEIRDQIMWIYGSGFPKSQDVGRQIDKSQNKGKFIGTGATQMSGGPKEFPDGALPRSEKMMHEPETDEAKQWSGWGTQLKPAHEPIVMARKPVIGSIRENVLEHGTGAINIDATRVPYLADEKENPYMAKPRKAGIGIKKFAKGDEYGVKTTDDELKADGFIAQASELGRFPANVLGEIDEPYQKYFYCPKVNRSERHIGFPENSKGANIDANTHGKTPHCNDCNKTFNGSNDHSKCDPSKKTFKEKRDQDAPDGNNHPTVKPIELMKYLIKLVTPPNGHILDPFNGSGSTGCAAVELGFDYTGIELDPNYVEIANKRISHWENECKPKTTYNNLFQEH